jgi:uncharacterized protein (DUF58 family)
VQLSPVLRQRLGRIRLVATHVVASGGVGERRSAQRGEGIEFEQHRPFQAGDDARRIDPHLYARLGVPFVREYNVGQQLTVTILVDASRSMALGAPPKLEVARALATGLAYVALSSSDAVQTGVWCDDRLGWRPRSSGAARIDELERWWASFAPRGGSDLLAAARRVRHDLPRRGLTIVISDLWSDDAAAAIDVLGSSGQSLVVIQVLSAEEADPRRHVGDALRMIDVETGDEVEVTLGPSQLARYDELLATWTQAVRQRAIVARGTFARVTNDQSVEDVFLRTLPASGVLR